MSKRDGFHLQFFHEGRLALPPGDAERKEAARLLFGAAMVESVDGWVEQAGRVLRGAPEFADYSDAQRESILSLVAYASYGALFSECVAMDQFLGGDIEVRLVERDEEGAALGETLIAGATEEELHHSFHDWAERFGDHYDASAGSRFAVRS